MVYPAAEVLQPLQNFFSTSVHHLVIYNLRGDAPLFLLILTLTIKL